MDIAVHTIEIKELEFSYDSAEGRTGFHLSIPSWNIAAGDFVSLLGPNGCGKSTLLRLIAHLTDLPQGKILIDGRNIKSYSRTELAKKIAYVPQKNFNIFPFSVYEIVLMGRTPYLGLMGFEKQKDITIVDQAIEMMQIGHIRKKGINEISGGEAQRVFIARALAQKAEIILLDEPNAHLDLRSQIMIFDLLKKLNEEEKITILTVSHDLNLVGLYSKKVAMMREGIIALEGEKTGILNEKNIREIFKIESAVFRSADNRSFNVLLNPNPGIRQDQN
jgi:iron complex transport system ATP-binding protein